MFLGTHWAILNGDFYVSNIGNDTTGDGSPQAPFKTITRAVQATVGDSIIVVGPGFYAEAVDCQVAGIKKLSFIGDGMPVLVEPLSGPTGFINTNINTIVDGFAITGQKIAFSGFVHRIRNCHISGTQFNGFGGTIENTICQDVILDATNAVSFDSCTLWNVNNNLKGKWVRSITNCEIGGQTVLMLERQYAPIISSCNFEADVSIWLDNDLFQGGVGLPGENFTETNQFTRIDSIGDYSVELNSVLAKAGTDKMAIGASHAAYQSDLTRDIYYSEGLTTVTNSGITSIKVVDGNEYGYFITPPMYLGRRKFVHKINIFASEQAEIEDVKGEAVFARLLGFRYANSHSDLILLSKIDGDMPRPFLHMKINSTPTKDQNGFGNGDIQFDPISAQNIYATWVQLKIGVQKGENFILQENGDFLLQENNSKLIWSS